MNDVKEDLIIDTKPVRASEQLDWRALADYLQTELPKVGDFDLSAPLAVEQFAGGHSNLTYLVRFGAAEFVLRRPPFGPVPPRAHDMAREFRILAAVHPVYDFAPRPVLLCEDLSVINAVFYLMERRRGLVIRASEPPQFADNPTARQAASAAMVNALARLHQIDVQTENLSALGKPAGFVARQVAGWTERWRKSQLDDLPAMDATSQWLNDNLPPEARRSTLVHGDFKLDNVMFDRDDSGRVVGVFDWEMSAVGDPLVDLGILLCYWIHAAETLQSDVISSVTMQKGWFTREEILTAYAAQTDFNLSDIAFYEVFAVFKLAVVIQQIYFRYKRGQTDDQRFADLGGRVAQLAAAARRLIDA